MSTTNPGVNWLKKKSHKQAWPPTSDVSNWFEGSEMQMATNTGSWTWRQLTGANTGSPSSATGCVESVSSIWGEGGRSKGFLRRCACVVPKAVGPWESFEYPLTVHGPGPEWVTGD